MVLNNQVTHSKSQNTKGVAFSSAKVESPDLEDEEDHFKEMAMFVKKFWKLFKSQKPMNKGSSCSSKKVFEKNKFENKKGFDKKNC